MLRFAVFGSPIVQSKSPVLHQAFATSVNKTLVYEKIEVKLGELKQALATFREQGGIGANVTVPLKVEAYELCDKLTEAARTAGAVNTLFWQHNEMWGDNTDGEGFIRDLINNLKLNLKDKRILILGAGGAARGILSPLLALSVKNIVIVNRTLLKAQSLANRDERIKAYSFDTFEAAAEAPFDLIINATSASLQEAVPPLAPHWVKGAIAIDLVYRLEQETVFMRWAHQQGATAVYDGLGMFVEQGALAFKRWFDVYPKTEEAMRTLRVK